MSFYQNFPHDHPKNWICPNCETSNDAGVVECPECFFERDDAKEILPLVPPAMCTCLLYVGDDLRCAVHGVTK